MIITNNVHHTMVTIYK